MSDTTKYSRRYSPKLKFQAVLEVIKGEKVVGQVAKAYGIHPTSINHWKKAFIEKGPEIFSEETTVKEYEKRIGELERMIGQKEVEIAFLKNFLGQID